MFPKLISFGSFFIPTYGLMVALGFLAGITIAARIAKRRGLNDELIMNLGVYCALAGLAGAKLLMFVLDFDYYRKDPSRLFSVDTLLSAGVWYGGFLAAIAFAAAYMKRQRLPALLTLDCFAPGVALGHAIGRLGCFATGCCWGAACDRAWAVTFTNPEANELTGVPLNRPLHPVQLYEAALTFLLFAWLYRHTEQPHYNGAIFGQYLALYSLVRIFTEFFREHAQALPFGGPLTITQWIAAGMFVAGLIIWNRARKSTAQMVS
jgi:phosphatidylglycerol:prolipoprotein diacylglycerol transferase